LSFSLGQIVSVCCPDEGMVKEEDSLLFVWTSVDFWGECVAGTKVQQILATIKLNYEYGKEYTYRKEGLEE
jgi:hypothetical protein